MRWLKETPNNSVLRLGGHLEKDFEAVFNHLAGLYGISSFAHFYADKSYWRHPFCYNFPPGCTTEVIAGIVERMRECCEVLVVENLSREPELAELHQATGWGSMILAPMESTVIQDPTIREILGLFWDHPQRMGRAEVERRLGSVRQAVKLLELMFREGIYINLFRELQTTIPIGLTLMTAKSIDAMNRHAAQLLNIPWQWDPEGKHPRHKLLDLIPHAESSGLADLIRDVTTGRLPQGEMEIHDIGPTHKRRTLLFRVLSHKVLSEQDEKILLSPSEHAGNQARVIFEDVTDRRRQQHIREELQLARRIQRGFLPKRQPVLSGWDIYGTTIPADEVGGDYYHFRTRGGQLFFTIADVSGKGIAASLMSASYHAWFQSVIEHEHEPAEIARLLNKVTFRNTSEGKYITAVIARLDLYSGEMTYSSAGHNTPLCIRRGGQVEFLDKGGIPLGLMETSAYEQGVAEMQPYDRAVLYTDGVTEAHRADGNMFEMDRLTDVLVSSGGQTLARQATTVRRALRHFVGSTDFGDDVSLVMVRRQGQ